MGVELTDKTTMQYRISCDCDRYNPNKNFSGFLITDPGLIGHLVGRTIDPGYFCVYAGRGDALERFTGVSHAFGEYAMEIETFSLRNGSYTGHDSTIRGLINIWKRKGPATTVQSYEL